MITRIPIVVGLTHYLDWLTKTVLFFEDDVFQVCAAQPRPPNNKLLEYTMVHAFGYNLYNYPTNNVHTQRKLNEHEWGIKSAHEQAKTTDADLLTRTASGVIMNDRRTEWQKRGFTFHMTQVHTTCNMTFRQEQWLFTFWVGIA